MINITCLNEVHYKILQQLPPPVRPPDWRQRLPYYMMKRVRWRRFQTKYELLRNRALSILVGYGAQPYSHESLHEIISSLNPLVFPRLLHNGVPGHARATQPSKNGK
jgi:hypothetical protein